MSCQFRRTVPRVVQLPHWVRAAESLIWLGVTFISGAKCPTHSVNSFSASCRYQRVMIFSINAGLSILETWTISCVPCSCGGVSNKLGMMRSAKDSPRYEIVSPSTHCCGTGFFACQCSSFSTTHAAFSCNTLRSHFSEARNGMLTVRPRSSMRKPMLRRRLVRLRV